MLQIIIEPNENYSLSEMAQMAIEGGCTWLLIANCIGPTDLRENLPQIVDMCRQSGVMLTSIGSIETAKEYSLHGVYLPAGCASPVKIREELGPEAVIGAEISTPAKAIELSLADIDYVSTPPSEPIEVSAQTIAQTRAGSCEIPFVCQLFSCSPKQITDTLNAGFSGICINGSIFNVSNPVEEIERIINLISK